MHHSEFLKAVTYKLRAMPYIGYQQVPLEVHKTYTEAEILAYLEVIHAQLYDRYVHEQFAKQQVALLRTQLDDVLGVLNVLDPPVPDLP